MSAAESRPPSNAFPSEARFRLAGEPPAREGRRELSAAQKAGLGLLSLYKVVLSPLFPGSCRYLPSCSDYAREAVTTHGLPRGSWLALRRLSRCHPFGSSGFDPVPGRVPRD